MGFLATAYSGSDDPRTISDTGDNFNTVIAIFFITF